MGEVRALVLDRGDLDDVYGILADLGVRPVRASAGVLPGDLPAAALIIATPEALGSVRKGPVARLVLVTDARKADLDESARSLGVDYRVRQPVHPEALRLFLAHLLFAGEERRHEPRTPLGIEVDLREGARQEKAILMELSCSGCRLRLERVLAPGSAVEIELAASTTVPAGLRLRGRVARVDGLARGPGAAAFAAGIVFEALDEDSRQELGWLLVELGEVPPTLVPEFQPKRVPRGYYGRKVPALNDRGLRVLLGRDLSAGGMRLEPGGNVRLGDRFQVAIYGASREEPLLLWAVAVRDDGPSGVALRFEELDGPVRERLERIVASLPGVEQIRPDEGPDGRLFVGRRVDG